MKEELLNSLRESDTVKESNFNIQIIIDQRETIERQSSGIMKRL